MVKFRVLSPGKPDYLHPLGFRLHDDVIAMQVIHDTDLLKFKKLPPERIAQDGSYVFI
jgi:hypothetical protein